MQPRGEFLAFYVADTGIGIPQEKCELLFQNFSQVDSSFSRQYGGSGLGLAISKGLVELMGGEISVRNQEGKGSVFTFILPLKTVAKQSPRSQSAAKSTEEKPSAARILLAEDEPMIRELILLMLTQRGYQVDIAETGKDALEKWQGDNFDFILMDLQMPEMNGMEATQAIRARETGREKRTCIIGLTAHARQEIKEECLASGMDHVLIKPVKLGELYSAIETPLLRRAQIGCLIFIGPIAFSLLQHRPAPAPGHLFAANNRAEDERAPAKPRIADCLRLWHIRVCRSESNAAGC